MSEKIYVRAALKPDAALRPITDRGLLYPHPQHRGRYIGWRDCMPGEQPEHVIPGAAGVTLENVNGQQVVSYDPDNEKRRTGELGGVGPVSDLFLAGQSVGLVRTEPVRVVADAEIRRAILCGDLVECPAPTPKAPAEPVKLVEPVELPKSKQKAEV